MIYREVLPSSLKSKSLKFTLRLTIRLALDKCACIYISALFKLPLHHFGSILIFYCNYSKYWEKYFHTSVIQNWCRYPYKVNRVQTWLTIITNIWEGRQKDKQNKTPKTTNQLKKTKARCWVSKVFSESNLSNKIISYINFECWTFLLF